ncbi:hypothetical protein EX895_001723 [Sporisorium graminicola]|uniref:DNA-(apurinic or apyrimidinic site) lyase n=1 Tax=Sporisorium graminicola TaxID=280036 RepID=A0A4U7L1R3_9BASI|nr:hypothetical protein EX895_001723 [Sporisorium graminicola]TKY89192.1 hypothetical protein EX895_001723 [Sporisorium graminicola]
MAASHKLDRHEKHDNLARDDPEHQDFFGPRPPPGYFALRAATSQILLPLTVSNKCGQAFRWRCNKTWEPREQGSSTTEQTYEEQTEWSLCLSDRVVLLRQDEHRGFLYHRTLLPSSSASAGDSKQELEASRETVRFLIDYLSLDVPLESLYTEWADKDPVFARFATRFTGLRMLRQDPWECLCAFVCSSNNNIARIGQMVQNLCTHFSPVLLEHSYPAPPPSLKNADSPKSEAEGSTTREVEQGQVRIAFHPFPPPEALAKPGVEQKLRELGFGYRAKYLARTAQMLCERHGKGKSTGRQSSKAKADHLDETHWLYGIKAEEDSSSSISQLPSPPISTTDDIAKEERDSEPVKKRSRRTSSRGSRTSTAASSTSETPSETEGKTFDSVRSYLQHLRTVSYHEARQELIQFPGVGPKVADCILLMSLDQASSIPVDRHVFQFAEKWYRLRTKKYEEIADYFRDLWGEYAGWAHSVLFTADLRSFANYNVGGSKKEEEQLKLHGGQGFWGSKSEELGYPTPPPSQSVVKGEAVEQLQAVHSPPRIAIPDLVPQSLRQSAEGGALAERIKSRPKRKSRLS